MAAVGSSAGALALLPHLALKCSSSQSDSTSTQYWLSTAFLPIQPCRDQNPQHVPAETKGEKPILQEKCSGQEIKIPCWASCGMVFCRLCAQVCDQVQKFWPLTCCYQVTELKNYLTAKHLAHQNRTGCYRSYGLFQKVGGLAESR